MQIHMPYVCIMLINVNNNVNNVFINELVYALV